VLCSEMQKRMRLKPEECTGGSQLACNSYYQFCEIVTTSGKRVEVEPYIGCAQGGARACEEGREKLGADVWMEARKQKAAAEYKVAMEKAWQSALYRAALRKKFAARAQTKAKKAVQSAAAAGKKQVKTATLLGNAWLPQPQVDKEEKDLRDKMKKMKKRLMQMEQIFKGLRQVSPLCDEQYTACGKSCFKLHPMSMMQKAKYAIMGKVTKCQLKCKHKVANCVMKEVSGTYQNITHAAMLSTGPG